MNELEWGAMQTGWYESPVKRCRQQEQRTNEYEDATDGVVYTDRALLESLKSKYCSCVSATTVVLK